MNGIQMDQQNTTNYLVPAAGQTHAIKFEGAFSAVPYYVDWRQFRIDNFPFQPQGVYIDNTAGIADLVILIKPINYRVICTAGQTLEAQFPAPNGQTCEITGDGDASVIFVDYPVLPSGALVTLKGVPNVNITGITTSDILNVQMDPLAQGAVPYQVIEFPVPAECAYLAVTGAATNATFNPVDNENLRRLLITLSGDAALAVAGNIVVTVTLNGVQIFKRTINVPAAATGNEKIIADLEFNSIGLGAAAGTLVLATNVALAAGTLEANAYFTP